jgi:hypothetical protein
MHAPDNSSPSFPGCICGQLFSGASAIERRDAHVANPDPNSLGILLSRVSQLTEED